MKTWWRNNFKKVPCKFKFSASIEYTSDPKKHFHQYYLLILKHTCYKVTKLFESKQRNARYSSVQLTT